MKFKPILLPSALLFYKSNAYAGLDVIPVTINSVLTRSNFWGEYDVILDIDEENSIFPNSPLSQRFTGCDSLHLKIDHDVLSYFYEILSAGVRNNHPSPIQIRRNIGFLSNNIGQQMYLAESGYSFEQTSPCGLYSKSFIILQNSIIPIMRNF